MHLKGQPYCILIDLGSKFGTYVNNQRIPLEGMIVRENDCITLGRKWPRSEKYYGFQVRYKHVLKCEKALVRRNKPLVLASSGHPKKLGTNVSVPVFHQGGRTVIYSDDESEEATKDEKIPELILGRLTLQEVKSDAERSVREVRHHENDVQIRKLEICEEPLNLTVSSKRLTDNLNAGKPRESGTTDLTVEPMVSSNVELSPRRCANTNPIDKHRPSVYSNALNSPNIKSAAADRLIPQRTSSKSIKLSSKNQSPSSTPQRLSCKVVNSYPTRTSNIKQAPSSKRRPSSSGADNSRPSHTKILVQLPSPTLHPAIVENLKPLSPSYKRLSSSGVYDTKRSSTSETPTTTSSSSRKTVSSPYNQIGDENPSQTSSNSGSYIHPQIPRIDGRSATKTRKRKSPEGIGTTNCDNDTFRKCLRVTNSDNQYSEERLELIKELLRSRIINKTKLVEASSLPIHSRFKSSFGRGVVSKDRYSSASSYRHGSGAVNSNQHRRNA